MKKYAIFLPQFHAIKENDEWWGKGFTEWTNVKNAKSYFKEHIQPKHPKDDNYYNLLDKDVVRWQTDLLQESKIDGLVYYHYYFKGKKLLEKPAENLLMWKEIPQRFFFCWANHSWIRSWNGTQNMLVEQTYGSVEDWENHFQYLLQFFSDDRYEKIDNKPMFMLFKSSFPEKEKMFCYFDKRCKEEGFEGLYLIESFHGDIKYDEFKNELCSITSLVYFREPAVTLSNYNSRYSIFERLLNKIKKSMREKGILKKPRIVCGEKMIEMKIEQEVLNKKIGHGLWFEWDNTPRHKQRGYIITPFEKESFMKYMDLIANEDFLFINAWNEWAEGMMLEPTKELGYKYLDWIKEWSESRECK